jgi:serine/threonine protein kinase
LTQDSVLFVFVQIVLALEYLHRHNFLHRDMKPANILLSKKWICKLADFGSCLQFDENVDRDIAYSGKGQSPLYLPPESYVQSDLGTKRPYSQKADIWALGVLLYELIELVPPFSGSTLENLARSIVFNEPRKFRRENLSIELIALVMAMLQKNPKRRPTCKEILQTRVMMHALDVFVMRYEKAVTRPLAQQQQQQQSGGNTKKPQAAIINDIHTTNNMNVPSSPTSAVATANTNYVSDADRLLLKVLSEHRDLIFSDTLSSQKSREVGSRKRSGEKSKRAYANSRSSSSEQNLNTQQKQHQQTQ